MTQVWAALNSFNKQRNISFLFLGRMDVDEMIRAATPQQETTDNKAIKQKLDVTLDDTEPEAKKAKQDKKMKIQSRINPLRRKKVEKRMREKVKDGEGEATVLDADNNKQAL